MAAIPGKTQGPIHLIFTDLWSELRGQPHREAGKSISGWMVGMGKIWWGSREIGRNEELPIIPGINNGIIKSLIQSLQQSPKESLPKTHPKRGAGSLPSEAEWGSFGGGILHRL
jgi:hypothetical protein